MSCLRPSTGWISVLAAAALTAAAVPARAAAATVRLDFSDVARLVGENDRAVSGASLAAEASAGREGSLGRSFRPALGLTGGLESFETGAYARETQPYGDLEARLNLYRGGRDASAEGVRRAASAESRASAAATRAERVARARADFLRLVHAREAAALVREARAENAKLVERAERRIRRGLATGTDRLEFEVAESQLKEDEESFGHLALQLSIRLRAALGLAERTELETPASLEHFHDDALLELPLDAVGHPEAATLASRRDGARALADGAQRWWRPSVDAYAGKHLYTLRERDYRSAGLRDDAVAGGRLSLRLFDGGSEAAEARARRLESEAADRAHGQALRDIAARVGVLREELGHAHELVHFAEERIAMSRRYLDGTLDEYDRGVKNSLDVLSAAQRAAGYRRELVDRKLGYQLTRAELLREHGQ